MPILLLAYVPLAAWMEQLRPQLFHGITLTARAQWVGIAALCGGLIVAQPGGTIPVALMAASVLPLAAMIDETCGLIPNELVAITWGLLFIQFAATGTPVMFVGLVTVIVATVVCTVLLLAGGLGAGDAKLIPAVLGLLAVTFAASPVTGVVIFLLILSVSAATQIRTFRDRIRLGPHIAIAYTLTAAVGSAGFALPL